MSLAKQMDISSTRQELKMPHQNLSTRELQVLQQIVLGKPNKEIANQFSLSEKTVSTYRTRIMEKMHMNNIADLVIYAQTNQLII